MKTLGWPPNFVARCPVKLFEAAGGSDTWVSSGTAGEFHMRPLGNAVLHFQLRDLLDNQILFEHTMRKPDAFIVSSRRFFVIRLENGSFRGFGFKEEDAAFEMKKLVQKEVKPYSIQDSIGESLLKDTVVGDSKPAMPDRGHQQTGSTSKNKPSLVLYESVPKKSIKRSSQLSREQDTASMPSVEIAVFSGAPQSSMLQSKWKIVWKGLTGLSRLKRLVAISQVLGRREQEMEIGYPTDVKHVAHIGWDGPSVGGPNWIDELKPSPDFSSGPLRDFGQPRGSDWIHDAFSAAKWTTAGFGESKNLPPNPPAEYLDPVTANKKGSSKWKSFGLRQKSSNEAALDNRDM